MASQPCALTVNLSEQLDIDTALVVAQVVRGIITLGDLALRASEGLPMKDTAIEGFEMTSSPSEDTSGAHAPRRPRRIGAVRPLQAPVYRCAEQRDPIGVLRRLVYRVARQRDFAQTDQGSGW